MRRLWLGIGLLSVMIGHLGCENDKKFLRPKKPPEEYTRPPDDARYTNLPDLPKEYMNQDTYTKNKDGPDPGGFGSTGRGGRPGM